MEGIVSTRWDVYSFGIVQMEAFTNRKSTDEIFVGELNSNLLGTKEDHDFLTKRNSCCAESPEENKRINIQDAAVTLDKIKIEFLKDGGGAQLQFSNRTVDLS
ncbi:unnamed protein product [Malus baccata var. baccata]